MCVVTEETERVISERRLETLRVLAEALLNGSRPGPGVLDGAARALATNAKDFPVRLCPDPLGRVGGECSPSRRAA